MRKWLKWLLIGVVGLLVLCVFIGILVGNDIEEVEATPTVAVAEAVPTETPAPELTDTPAPEPTDTPIPTATPEPEPVLEPIGYSGTGDDLINIEKPGQRDDPVITYVTGNAAGRHFAVTGYDADGERTALLVNTTDPYEGIVPVDFRMRDSPTAQLEINAPGDWEIELRPITMARVVESPGTVAGTGDEVIMIEGEASAAKITGNATGRHFSVTGYGDNRPNLMVNTTDPYDGRVRVASGTDFLEITAVDEWEIALE